MRYYRVALSQSRIQYMEPSDLFFGSWKCARTLTFQDLPKNYWITSFCPRNAAHVKCSGIWGWKKEPFGSLNSSRRRIAFFYYKSWHLLASKTIFTQIARNCKTFSNCIKLGLEVHAISKVAPKNCWIPLRSCKNAIKCTKNAEQQQDWGGKYFS